MPRDESERLPLGEIEIPLNRDNFMRSMIRELSGTLQEVVGLEEASGFISVVGQTMGHQINEDYKKAIGVDKLSRPLVTEALIDLKARINGDFYLIEMDDEKIVLGNRACPFGAKVQDRPAMCMMTSNVFGSITADNLGYAKVVLAETIANGSPSCRVILYLSKTPESDAADGREYYGIPDGR